MFWICVISYFVIGFVGSALLWRNDFFSDEFMVILFIFCWPLFFIVGGIFYLWTILADY